MNMNSATLKNEDNCKKDKSFLSVNPSPSDYKQFVDKVSSAIPAKRIITNQLQLLAYSTDASQYRLIPKVIVQVHTEDEAITVIRQCFSLKIPVTFRAAGTSLSGQAVSDSVLMIASHKWRHYDILDNGMKIRLQPGIIGSRANIFLKPYGRKIGPDPASINAAMIGGIASNNASGMCCGTAQNSYQTVADVRLILYDGTVLNTEDSGSVETFKTAHPEMIREIEAIRDEIKSDKSLTNRIKYKYKIKNTTGYSINAFVDYDDPIDIIKHLIIGSEGTLAFISDITYNTVADEKLKACALLIFETIELACEAVPLLKKSPVSAVELLDRDSIRSVEDDPEAPGYFRTLPETACVLLVEIQADNQEQLMEKEQAVRKAVFPIQTIKSYHFTSDPKEYNFNWKARKGLLSSVGGLRNTGTTCIIEDVAFPVERLAEACKALKMLFKKYEYHDAVLFGHAMDGNLHLVFSQDFNIESEVKRYADLMNELSDIVVHQFDGSLKAEHGTGRNMAPFVEKEWGATAYKLMKRIKKLFDPDNLINPGVIINGNPNIHVENLKPLPAVNELVDKCMECGFCESACVAEGLTLSPRHRIVIAREIARLEAVKEANPADRHRLKRIARDSRYFSNETCATDGLCGLICPVKIDTGKYIKQLRHDESSSLSRKTSSWIAHHFAFTTTIMRLMLNTVYLFQLLFGNKFMSAVSSLLRKISFQKIPSWNPYFPKGSILPPLSPRRGAGGEVVYFPSCINRTMGKSADYDKNEVELTQKTVELLQRAGYTVIYPESLDNLCCGMAFSSKGFKEEGSRKSLELEAALLKASENGKYPILFDMSPCFFTFMEANRNTSLRVYDPIAFMLEFVMPKLNVKLKKAKVAVFPVCSVKKIGMEDNLLRLAELCAEEVTIIESNCCGFAGDRGFTFPELNAHGQRHLKEQIPHECHEGYSTSRTCEIGMNEHSGGISFKSIFYLIDDVTK
ncbi:MAG: FAD-binding oxidoreductase [Tannerella sp.]|jgi:D-lactate dehydrogenase|nr:FAD-binding oxidoreductase [Tannerella sp.]